MAETGVENSGDKSLRKAAWCLFLIAAPLAEILSENQPLLSFFQPAAFIFMTFSYGLPVLLIRELAAAKRLNVAGLFLLGLAYGLLNEGILAKTLTQPSGQPVGDFAGWGQAGMLQLGWSFMIVPWHALHSVLYPILITHWLFPAAAGRRWLRGRPLKAMLVVLFALYAIYFLREERRELSSFIAYAVATAVFIWGALRCVAPGATPAAVAPVSLKPLLFGALTLLFYIFQFVAAKRMPFAVYAVITTAVYMFAFWRMRKSGWRPAPETLLFGIGDALMFSAFAAFFCATKGRAMEAIVAEALFLAAFLWLVRAIRRAPVGRGIQVGFS